MKISELSRATGVSVETIKFYVREGLIPAGESVRANRTDYTDAHAKRILLIRALRDVGGLPLSSTLRVLDAFDQWGDDPRVAFHLAFDALSTAAPNAAHSPQPVAAPAPDTLRRDVDALLAEVGWQFGERTPAAEVELMDAISKVRDYLYPDLTVQELKPLAQRVDELTGFEMHWRPLRRDTALEELQLTVIKTVLFEKVLVALRRLARESIRDRILESQGRVTRPVTPPQARGTPGSGASAN